MEKQRAKNKRILKKNKDLYYQISRCIIVYFYNLKVGKTFLKMNKNPEARKGKYEKLDHL